MLANFFIQADRVLRYSDLSDIIESSTPSKVQLVLFHQIIHIRYDRAAFQISILIAIPHFLLQQARQSTTVLSIPHLTPNKEKTSTQSSLANKQ